MAPPMRKNTAYKFTNGVSSRTQRQARIAPDGRVLSLPITSEEDGEKATVSRWGVRVSKEVFDQVRQDKNDNGIIDNIRVGEKRRGGLEIDYLMPVQGGVILKW